ncbi:glycosyltransferase family 2 protein [Nostoc sp. 106C]|uniref:glycosyltransferase family 2 protein n=1 Tax=Nostoc sp. 106C TaxID=1932667 RepID=UPI000A363107|nr:glycosyltransferase family 2 protein [Nostoc sp. 106C]OUL31378.1 glycosyl transferase family 2 [Nostoc sp. 106C]
MRIAQLLPKKPTFQNIRFPTVDSIPEGIHRPFWSVMITTYKRTEYLADAIKSVLEQGIEADEMQIEVVDDCSPENIEVIEVIVNEVGQGRVSLYRQPKNVGIYANWNTCIARARGHWIHILSDDDLIMPGFYEAYRHYIETYKCQVVLGQSVFINDKNQWFGVSNPLQDSDGLLDNALWVLSRGNPIRTPGIVVARQAYEKLGGFTSDLVFTPDWEMWTRLAASVKLAYVNRPYSIFRAHTGSQTRRLVLTGDSVTDCLTATKIIQSRFNEPKHRKEIQDFVNHSLSDESLYLSRHLVRIGYYQSALLHATWVLRLTPSFSSFKNILIVSLRILKSILKKFISSPSLQN